MVNCVKHEKNEVESGQDNIGKEKKLAWIVVESMLIAVGVFLLFELGYALLFVSDEVGLYVASFALIYVFVVVLFERAIKKSGK